MAPIRLEDLAQWEQRAPVAVRDVEHLARAEVFDRDGGASVISESECDTRR
ncbi:MAG: hypothetical protein AAGA95_13875 [Pseudomonadota bacterium]